MKNLPSARAKLTSEAHLSLALFCWPFSRDRISGLLTPKCFFSRNLDSEKTRAININNRGKESLKLIRKHFRAKPKDNFRQNSLSFRKEINTLK